MPVGRGRLRVVRSDAPRRHARFARTCFSCAEGKTAAGRNSPGPRERAQGPGSALRDRNAAAFLSRKASRLEKALKWTLRAGKALEPAAGARAPCLTQHNFQRKRRRSAAGRPCPRVNSRLRAESALFKGRSSEPERLWDGAEMHAPAVPCPPRPKEQRRQPPESAALGAPVSAQRLRSPSRLRASPEKACRPDYPTRRYAGSPCVPRAPENPQRPRAAPPGLQSPPIPFRSPRRDTGTERA